MNVNGSMIFWNELKGCVTIDHKPTGEYARTLSKHLGGTFYVGRGFLTWACGGKSIVVLEDAAFWRNISPARDIVQKIKGEEPNHWTIGSLARELLDWLGPANSQESCYARSMLEAEQCWRYYRCEPCELQEATMYDLDSYFYNLLNKAPTPNPLITKKRLFWLDPRDDQEAERFQAIKDGVRPHKLLRNAVVGSMVGGSTVTCFCKGKLRRQPTPKGIRQELGITILRTAYELTQLEAEISNAVYSNVDSIIIEGNAEPKVWPLAGLPFKCAGEGYADVWGIGKYKIGEKETAYYKLGGGHRQQIHTPKVETLYHGWVFAAA